MQDICVLDRRHLQKSFGAKFRHSGRTGNITAFIGNFFFHNTVTLENCFHKKTLCPVVRDATVINRCNALKNENRIFS